MPDRRRHRGMHPEDAELFSPAARDRLRGAVDDLCWLLGRGYAMPSALKLVGDRWELTQRQRMAVMRCACSDAAAADRRGREVSDEAMAGRDLLVDGYNVLTTIEAALSGGVVLVGRDGCWRDIASVHGTWRRVQETEPALELAGRTLAALGVGPVTWYLDSPVSNSGRLRNLVEQVAANGDWAWRVELVSSPDAVLRQPPEGQVIATADSAVLDRGGSWHNLARSVIGRHVPGARVVEM